MDKITKNNILDRIIRTRLENNYLDFQFGSGCYKIKKLTKTFVIFKSCYDKTEIKFFFRLKDGDLDDKVMEHLLRKKKNQHFRIDQTLSIYMQTSKAKKIPMTTNNFNTAINALGNAYTTDLCEYFDVKPQEVLRFESTKKDKTSKTKQNKKQ